MDVQIAAAEMVALAAAQAGDSDAFAVLVARHEDAAFRLVLLLLRDGLSPDHTTPRLGRAVL